MTIEQALKIGTEHHRAGRLPAACDLFRRAIAAAPHVGDLHFHLALALEDLGQLGEAAAAYEAGLRLTPNVAEAHNNLSNLLVQLGRHDEALQRAEEAIRLRPNLAAAHSNRGNALRALGRETQAVAAYRTALQIDPKFAEAHMNLGITLFAQQQMSGAAQAFAAGAALAPGDVQVHNALGNTLTILGRFNEAASAFSRAIELMPDAPEPHNNLGYALLRDGKMEQALAEFHRAIQLRPNYTEPYINRGSALLSAGRLHEAAESCRRAIIYQPDSAEAYTNLGHALKDQGLAVEAFQAYRRAVAINPNAPEMGSNLLYGMHFVWPIDERKCYEAHRAWGEKFGGNSSSKPSPRRARAGGKIRIGYVSGDLRDHPVGRFMLPIFEHHDRERTEIVCFAQSLADDHVSKALRAAASEWHVTVGRSNDDVAQLVRDRKIDVLVDLAGHTGSHRLLVFAQRPAPVQMTYLGYPDTTGMSSIDYRITDGHADPIGMTDSLHAERLIRLEGTAWCFAPPHDSPDVGSQPAERNGVVTFGSFNNLSKMNPRLIDLWARVLERVAGSRLVLKAAGLRDEPVRQRVVAEFAQRGIDARRVECIAAMSDPKAHLQAYDRIDIALDTFPYHGTTTTCEAMWMGAAVVSLAGNVHVSRVGVSLLNGVGHSEWLAQNEQEYVDRCASLAGQALSGGLGRSELRQAMQRSVLMDAPRFVRQLESVYRRCLDMI